MPAKVAISPFNHAKEYSVGARIYASSYILPPELRKPKSELPRSRLTAPLPINRRGCGDLQKSLKGCSTIDAKTVAPL